MKAPEGFAVPASLATLFSLSFLPGRIDGTDAAALLGFHPDDIALLMRRGVLPHLGEDIADNAPKWFASSVVLELARNPEWLSQATTLVAATHRAKQSKRVVRRNPLGESAEARALPANWRN